MKRLLRFAILGLSVCSCGSLTLLEEPVAPVLNRGSLYPKMYEEKPVSLLIMPPMNFSSNVEAKDYLYTAISRPLIDAGYYVVPTTLSLEILKEESAYDSELFLDRPLDIFNSYFGADAVVFVEIKDWKKVALGIETNLRYFIKSTHTGEILFDRTMEFTLNTSAAVIPGSSLTAFLVNVTASVVNTAATDHIIAARIANEQVFKDIPRGKYDPQYLQDQNVATDAKDIYAPNGLQSWRDQQEQIKKDKEDGVVYKIQYGGKTYVKYKNKD